MTGDYTAPRHYETIVIGAGIAGLSCGSRLFNHQHFRAPQKLLVLEGRERTGGRINSVHVNGCRLDVGANWIHGVGTDEEPNPLVKILPQKRYRQLQGSVVFRAPLDDGRDGDDDWIKVHSPGSPSALPSLISSTPDRTVPAGHGATIMAVLWGMLGSLHEVANDTPTGQAKNTPMLEAVAKSELLQNAFRELPQDYHRILSAMPQFIENIEAAPLAAQSAEHSGEAAMGLLEYALDDFDGDQVFLQDGYLAVVNELAKELVEAELVRFKTDVKCIHWASKPIKVETNSGDYTADQVVCTLPLGVLKYPSSPLFEPPLPVERQEAIAALGYGTLDKIFLVYDRAWWAEEPYISIYRNGIVRQPFEAQEDALGGSDQLPAPDSFMGFTDELPGIEIKEDGQTTPGLRLLSFINLDNLTGYPALSAFVSCSNATYVESLSDQEAGGILHRALSRWLGREPPKPTGIYVTRWAQDRYSRGSYSHMITGMSETKHREAFQEPIFNGKGAVLRFAGEHTSRNHFATAHGALISGWREAGSILQGLKQNSKC
ncbi:amine oxidase [Teratosphaeria nubilosa]|uniref:Amine oxidase n=1 Tax=Teratosphaeria nubilosa TaxID=161662 RepID=A0A6G1LM27_9PEZI|nr:amine oxidase [Teratosphaeria nubilosa]